LNAPLYCPKSGYLACPAGFEGMTDDLEVGKKLEQQQKKWGLGSSFWCGIDTEINGVW